MMRGLPAAPTRIHEAVQQGMNYLGICAGAFLDGDGRGYYKSFDLASGVRLGFYAAETRGIRKAAVAIAGVNAASVEHYWEDGPELSGWGTVVGKYPTGIGSSSIPAARHAALERSLWSRSGRYHSDCFVERTRDRPGQGTPHNPRTRKLA
ncbi:hypothetical protein BH11GEM2_BH11GEM2_31380 [soil metagenome]